ncbi:MAG TPA: MBL fold metallo-hydrolase [Dehalococcoidia bacterium]|nr:MBL fold metallo-hydrolase [Dehalococcoidia bacterium]
MKIGFLGAHNTESRDSRLVSLLIDDVLALDAGGLTSSLTLEQQLRLKAVLLTHCHYDHIRDIPLIAMNLFLSQAAIDVYSIPSVGDALAGCLLNGELYNRFMESPKGKETIRFHTIEPYKEIQIEGYGVLPLPVVHSVPAVGYRVTSSDGRSIFYTGDTGPGLAHLWRFVSPQLIVIEVTAPNRYRQFGIEKCHLTPGLLKEELLGFREVKGYLPDVLTVHMNPELEAEIESELSGVAKELGNSITLAYEGRQVDL